VLEYKPKIKPLAFDGWIPLGEPRNTAIQVMSQKPIVEMLNSLLSNKQLSKKVTCLELLFELQITDLNWELIISDFFNAHSQHSIYLSKAYKLIQRALQGGGDFLIKLLLSQIEHQNYVGAENKGHVLLLVQQIEKYHKEGKVTIELSDWDEIVEYTNDELKKQETKCPLPNELLKSRIQVATK
jgi:hypothetical protein